MIKCTKCDNEYPGIKKEYIGIILILVVVLYIYVFGIYASTIVWSILFAGTGIYWIVQRPSKKYICKNCEVKNKNLKD
jgi:hypothetical protein